jgi:hypothetical protein
MNGECPSEASSSDRRISLFLSGTASERAEIFERAPAAEETRQVRRDLGAPHKRFAGARTTLGRAHLDAGADLGDRARLLVRGHVAEADALEPDRRREPADAGTYDRDAEVRERCLEVALLEHPPSMRWLREQGETRTAEGWAVASIAEHVAFGTNGGGGTFV